MSIRRATPIFPAADISAGISKELGKHFQTYKSLKLIPRSSIEDKAVFLRSQMFLKKIKRPHYSSARHRWQQTTP